MRIRCMVRLLTLSIFAACAVSSSLSSVSRFRFFSSLASRMYPAMFAICAMGRVIRELGTPAELVGRVLGAQRSRTVPAERDCPPEGAARERHGLGTLWKVLLAICAAPIAIPLILVVVAMVLGLVVLILALVAGVAVGGVVAIGAGVFTACAGFSVLFSAGLPTMMFFCGVGLLSSGVGLLLIAGSFLLAGLCFRGMAALLGRWLNRRGM